MAAVLVGSCALAPEQPPGTPAEEDAAVPAGSAPQPSAPLPDELTLPASRWIKVGWDELPGWQGDAPAEALAAMRQTCHQPRRGWHAWCAEVQLAPAGDDPALRAAFERWLQPYRVEAPDGRVEGLATGYFEPLINARRRPDARHRHPLHAAPDDLATRQPHWSRREAETLPEARRALAARVIAWAADPLDVLMLQIQGSGRVRLTEADGRQQIVRLAYAGHNGHGYRSVGRWLIDQGQLPETGASWQAIRAWAAAQPPERVQAMLWANPRLVYFREEALPDPEVGPRGAMGVPLTPGRSIAVDPRSIPYGAPVWLATTEPLSETPLQRLVSAQDTGSAIVGAVRADFFWGWGDEALAQAGRMKQPLRLWVLWPRSVPLPAEDPS